MAESKGPKIDVRRLFGSAPTVNIDDFMRGLREKDANSNPFQFWRCEDRNVVLIGRTRTGKSTIAQVVNDILHVAGPQELYSETKHIQYHSIATDTKDRLWYHFNFIDVPGFFDISTTNREKLSNEKIVSYLQELMQKGHHHCPHVCVRFQLGSRNQRTGSRNDGLRKEDVSTSDEIHGSGHHALRTGGTSGTREKESGFVFTPNSSEKQTARVFSTRSSIHGLFSTRIGRSSE